MDKQPSKAPAKTCRGPSGEVLQGDRKNIPPDAHRRSSVVARALMQMQSKPVK